MTDLAFAATDDSRLSAWLRSAGIAAMVAAALGSIVFATPAMPEPASNSSCHTDVLGGPWRGWSCDDSRGVSAN